VSVSGEWSGLEGLTGGVGLGLRLRAGGRELGADEGQGKGKGGRTAHSLQTRARKWGWCVLFAHSASPEVDARLSLCGGAATQRSWRLQRVAYFAGHTTAHTYSPSAS